MIERMEHAIGSVSGGAGGRELTLEEWIALDEDEPGEWVDGRLEDEEVPDYAHELCVTWLTHMIRTWLAASGAGFVGGSDAKFLVKQRRGRKPDASVYLPGTKPPPRRGVVRVAPDILIEVITPTARDIRRDRLEKMDDYAAFGVRFYWLVDPESRLFEVYALREGLYARALGADGGRQDHIPGCEGLVLDLDALWSEIDRLGESEA